MTVSAAAEAAGLTLSGYLAYRALTPEGGTGLSLAQKRALATELFAVRRILGGIGTNVNQIAKAANATHTVDSEELAAQMRALTERLPRLDAVIGELWGERAR